MSNPANENLAEMVRKLKAENDQLIKTIADQKNKGPALKLKVSEKGAVSLYGMGRFPVTLYGEQWLKVVEMGEVIKTFIEVNKTLLHVKGTVPATAPAGASSSASAGEVASAI